MLNQLAHASGYLTIFLVPLLLVVGIGLDVPSLAFAMVMMVFPLGRRLLGHVRAGESIDWRESISTALDKLPLIYAGVLTVVVSLVVWHLVVHGARPLPHAIGLGLSLWMTMLFATCAAHELIHRRSASEAMVGHVIAGIAGYPMLAVDHLQHHARAGDTRSAEWPRVNESMWGFSYRRAVRILAEAYAPGSATWHRGGNRNVQSTRVATAVSAVTAGCFALAGGLPGLALYLAVAVGVAFGLQLMTYIQHWGLGDDRQGAAAYHGYSWEDDCRFQVWTTLSISLHQAHHENGHTPYYLVSLRPDSPRLPTGYVVLMVLSAIPPLWRKAMLPALEHWERNPSDPRSPGRNLTCFALYGDRPTASVSP